MEYKLLKHNEITQELFDQIYNVESSSTYEPYSKDILSQIVYDTNIDTFVMLNDIGEIVGFINTNSHTKKYENSIYVINLSVIQNYKKYLFMLMNEICEHYENNERELFSSEVDVENVPSTALHIKLGFEKVESLSSAEEVFYIINKNVLKNNLKKYISRLKR